MLLTIMLLAATALVLRFIFSEIRLHRAGDSPLGLRRLRLRIIAGGLLIGLFLAISFGVVVLKLTAPDDRPLFFLIYWLSCLLAAMAVMTLAMIDMLQVSRLRRNHGQDLWKNLSQIFTPTERDKKNKS
jgi:hypothetical protein